MSTSFQVAPHPHTPEVTASDHFSIVGGDDSSDGGEAPAAADTCSDTGTRVAVGNRQEGARRLPGGLIRVDRTYYHSGTDQHDYETKFAEDQRFEEMAPMARVFKMSLEEYAKLDSDKVEDWRDGLDVLLVFAGVFSAVVSTLVGQTSSKLQVDFGEISAHLMTEMVLLQRAAMNNLPDSSVPVSDVTLTSALRVSSTDTWVNGLWFTSLALSLAAALIAVLTKQWIHQFLTSTSGTAQDRLRIRQFRYEQLQEWHVPLIIGMLPIFMHISLGAFLAGLVVYVRALSTPIAVAVGVIAFAAFVVYFGTNLHPIFHPSSPYKTFLTRYTYRLYHDMCERLINIQIPPISPIPSLPTLRPMSIVMGSTNPRALPSESVSASPVRTSSKELSLERVESLMVDRVALQLDARALSDLYNLSSNTCVKSIILQSFSNIPLQTIHVVKEKIGDLDAALAGYIASIEYTLPEKQAAFERLFRAHIRIRTIEGNFATAKPAAFKPDMRDAMQEPDALSVLLDERLPASHAAYYLREHILRTEDVAYHDIISWARIIQRALEDGSEWLDVEDYESPVWRMVLPWLVESHGCLPDTKCHSSFVELLALPVLASPDKAGKLDLANFRLKVREYPDYPSTMKVMLSEVFIFLMRTSIAEYILSVSYPDACIHEDFLGLPVDILLNLAILQSPKLCTTSRSSMVYGDGNKSAMGLVLQYLREYLSIIEEYSLAEGGTLKQHPSVVRASFRAVSAVVHAPGFIDGSLTPDDARDIVSVLARTLRLDATLFGSFCGEITPPVFDAVVVAAFELFLLEADTVTIITDILWAHMGAGRQREHLPLDIGIKMYCSLVEEDWLTRVDDELMDFLTRRELNVDKSGRMLYHFYAYTLLAVAYVDGLEILSTVSSSCHKQNLEYLREHSLVLCKLLTLADRGRHGRLRTLVSLIPSARHIIQDFTSSSDFQVLYDAYNDSFHEVRICGEGQALYGPRDDFLSALNTELKAGSSQPDVHAATTLSSSLVTTKTAVSGSSSGSASKSESRVKNHSITENFRGIVRKVAFVRPINNHVEHIGLGAV